MLALGSPSGSVKSQPSRGSVASSLWRLESLGERAASASRIHASGALGPGCPRMCEKLAVESTKPPSGSASCSNCRGEKSWCAAARSRGESSGAVGAVRAGSTRAVDGTILLRELRGEELNEDVELWRD